MRVGGVSGAGYRRESSDVAKRDSRGSQVVVTGMAADLWNRKHPWDNKAACSRPGASAVVAGVMEGGRINRWLRLEKNDDARLGKETFGGGGLLSDNLKVVLGREFGCTRNSLALFLEG